jgi:photosystem II oxygen-evolving enhancer protein 1
MSFEGILLYTPLNAVTMAFGEYVHSAALIPAAVATAAGSAAAATAAAVSGVVVLQSGLFLAPALTVAPHTAACVAAVASTAVVPRAAEVVAAAGDGPSSAVSGYAAAPLVVAAAVAVSAASTPQALAPIAAPGIIAMPQAMLMGSAGFVIAVPLMGYAGWKAIEQLCGCASDAASSGNGQEKWKGVAVTLAAALTLGSEVQPSLAGPFTQSEIQTLTYDQIKGTGLANTCPTVEDPDVSDKIAVSGKEKLTNFCLEPTTFHVLEEKLTIDGIKTEAVDSKVVTGRTYTLAGMEGRLEKDGAKVRLVEQDGLDHAQTTVQLPGGERVPLLFTVKNLVAEANTPEISTNTKFAGSFKVPSYRTNLYIDPKGRAASDFGDDGHFQENKKAFDIGKTEFTVTSVNADLGEIGGVFVHQQPSDEDLGFEEPKTVLVQGEWFGQIN